jgi:hypothetical protein
MIAQVIKLIKDEQRRVADASVAYRPLSHDEYIEQVGKYRGLQEALDIIDEVLKGNEED